MHASLYSPELEAELARNDTRMAITRNALLEAGNEMGKHGDHWPAIEAILAGVEDDHNRLQNELIIAEQLKKATLELIDELNSKIPHMVIDQQDQAKKILHDVLELYEARFSPITEEQIEAFLNDDVQTPGFKPWASAAMMIEQLGEEV
ncbi:MAG: hypothetical protein EBZ69_05340 [Alphaproteobacteria bacterium]|nr:hypothetical protein [Alphaproteobacteria bacterium]NDC56218.1 hypothetical protein [Alphaproteobacteria bacterium]NDG04473.1 hypothetical protein [Alphaproteobacteria bacterium]